jgi:hypothetical protein
MSPLVLTSYSDVASAERSKVRVLLGAPCQSLVGRKRQGKNDEGKTGATSTSS